MNDALISEVLIGICDVECCVVQFSNSFLVFCCLHFIFSFFSYLISFISVIEIQIHSKRIKWMNSAPSKRLFNIRNKLRI